MIGSIWGRSNDYTKPSIRYHMRPAKYTEPFETDCAGFNTRFSLFDIEQKIHFCRDLTDAELKFYMHIKGLK